MLVIRDTIIMNDNKLIMINVTMIIVASVSLYFIILCYNKLYHIFISFVLDWATTA